MEKKRKKERKKQRNKERNKERKKQRKKETKKENSIAETYTEFNALKSRMNNADVRICDLEERIMEITQSEQQSKNQMKNMKAI